MHYMTGFKNTDLNRVLFKDADPIEFYLRIRINVNLEYTMYKLMDDNCIALHLGNNNMNQSGYVNGQINSYKTSD
jgi:hypothetical protein